MNNDRHSWADVAAARIPAAGLAALGPVRCRPGVAVIRVAGFFWVKFHPGDGELIRILLPLAGVEFFALRGGLWARFDQRLPTADGPPADGGTPLDRVVFPAPVKPVEAPPAIGPAARLTVVRGGVAQSATAVRCAVSVLARWADTAPAADLAAVRAARCDDRAVLLGDRLPLVLGGERFWGKRVLAPVGFRPEPDLPADVLRAACRVAPAEMLVLDATGAEAIPDEAFEPLTRAGIRLASR